MFRHLRIALAVSPLLVGLMHPMPALADTAITVDCGDGAPISGSVDLNTLTELGGSVQAMLDNPSGSSCALSQLSALDPLASTNDPGSFVVGGGRFFAGQGTQCVASFGISGHVDGNGIPHGIQNLSVSNSPGNQPCGGEGHLKANVTCVAVDGNRAEIRGVITEATGSQAPPSFFVGDTLVTDVQDNGKPNTGVDDEITVFSTAAGTDKPCSAPPPGSAFVFTVDNGNVTVHDG
jgi:hypothetical protein